MPIATKAKTPATKPAKVEARCEKWLKRRVLHAKKSTGCVEADFVLAALEEFFANHKTPAQQIAAVRRSRTAIDAMPMTEDAK